MIQLELALQTPSHTVLTEKDKILRYRLIVLRKGIQLEKLGMKRRGPSCTSIARQELGMPKNAKRDDLIDALTALIDVFEK